MVQKRLSVFEDIIADMFINKKSNPVVTEIFIRGRKLNISISLITQSYLAVPKYLWQNYTYYFIIKIPSKRKLCS